MLEDLNALIKERPNFLAIQCYDPFFWDHAKRFWQKGNEKIVINSKDDFYRKAGERGLFSKVKYLQANFSDLAKKDAEEILAFKSQKGTHALVRVSDKVREFAGYKVWKIKKPVKYRERMDLVKSIFKYHKMAISRDLDRYIWDIGCQTPSQISKLLELWQLTFKGDKTVTQKGVEALYFGTKEKSVFFDMAKELKRPVRARRPQVLKKFLDQGENILGLLGFIGTDLFKGELYAVSKTDLVFLEDQIKRGGDAEKLLSLLYLTNSLPFLGPKR